MSRDARSRAADRPVAAAARRGSREPLSPMRRPARGAAPNAGAGSSRPMGDGLVVGTVPFVARSSGALLVLAALAGVAALFPTYLVVGGKSLSLVTGLGGAPVALIAPVAHLAVGVVLARGRVPKFGLAYAAVAGALAVGQLLIEIYRGSSSTARPAVEVIAGQRVLTSGIGTRPGWVLEVAALVLVVAAGVVATVGWGRTVMEDTGPLDPVRSGLAGGAVLLGVATVLALALPAVDVPDRLVKDPTTGLETVVTSEGPQALLERPGLALLGGLLLAGAVLLCSVVAPSLRPRLAAVGGLLAIAVVVLSSALEGLHAAVASSTLEWTVPGAGQLLTGLGYVLLTVLAWRLRRTRG